MALFSLAQMRATLLILAVFLAGCDGCGGSSVEPDSRPAFVLDASKPFVIELGRGSGMRGLDVVRVRETGLVELYRIAGGQNVESASLRLSNADVATLVGLVNSQRLTGMGRTYSDPNVADGTQWILWIEQPPSTKSIYFNNSFPDQITAFAKGLDALLHGAGLATVAWTPVPRQQGREHQAALWARIAK